MAGFSPRWVTRVTEEDFRPLTAKPEADPREEGFTCNLISRVRSGSEDLRITYCRMLPHQYHIRHHHPNAAEFYFVIAGTCAVYLGGEVVSASPGTCIYIPANTVHAVRNESESVCELLAGFNRPEYAECGLVYDE
ncbi:MAG TPA: cupin domain-containing protein [bacterium]|nr:cupin domain-containing protein [bacterium]